MKRRVPTLLVALVAVAGCSARHPAAPPPEMIAIKVAAADMARYRAMARGCGAVSTRTETIGDATLLVVGKDSPVAARDCFFARAQADYRANHPVRAWIEGVVG